MPRFMRVPPYSAAPEYAGDGRPLVSASLKPEQAGEPGQVRQVRQRRGRRAPG